MPGQVARNWRRCQPIRSRASAAPHRPVGRLTRPDSILHPHHGTRHVRHPNQKTFDVTARRLDAHGSTAHCKDTDLALDTDLGGRRDAFNPAELLLAAWSACMLKRIERVTPILQFQLRGVEVRVHGVHQDVPPQMESIDYEILVDTDESEHRLDLLHENVKKYGTVFNTVVPGTKLSGALRRAD